MKVGIYKSLLNQQTLNRKLEIHVRENQYDALTSLVFNAGAYIWKRSPNFKKLLRGGDLDKPENKEKVVKEFATYIHYTVNGKNINQGDYGVDMLMKESCLLKMIISINHLRNSRKWDGNVQ